MPYRIQPITAAEARQILSWRYPEPYNFYNPPPSNSPEVFVEQFLVPENGFHGVRDLANRFIGFCSFGFDGQVPGGIYEPGPLDIGLGMKPEETNRGQGLRFFRAVVAYGIEQYAADVMRLSVAKFNARAIRVYEQAGFSIVSEFLEIPSAEPHLMMEYRHNNAAV